MVGRALVADEEALVEVGPRGLVHRGGALHALIHRQVADVAVVELQRQLLLERQRVELARGLERRLHDPRRHAVAREVEETDALARVADLRGDRVQSAVGGCVPRPRNDRPAVARILAPTSRLNATMTGDSKCGSTCRPRMTASLAPSARAASTNSRSRSESTTPRTRRV